MVTPAREYVSPDDYLARERAAETKSEYYGGRVFAIAGGSERHSLISSNIGRRLGNQLEGRPCRVYNSDMRVLVEESGLHTYPDVTVVCGQPQFVDDRRDTLTNPLVVIQVLSPSTDTYDRTVKADMYRDRPTIAAIVLVERDRRRIEVQTRSVDGTWALAIARGADDAVRVAPIDCLLRVDEVYQHVDLPEQTPLRAVPEQAE